MGYSFFFIFLAPQPSEDVDGVPLDDVYFSTAVEGGYPSSYGTNTATTYPQNYGNYYYGNTQGQYSIPNTEGSVTKTKINLPYGLDPSKLQPSTMEVYIGERNTFPFQMNSLFFFII